MANSNVVVDGWSRAACRRRRRQELLALRRLERFTERGHGVEEGTSAPSPNSVVSLSVANVAVGNPLAGIVIVPESQGRPASTSAGPPRRARRSWFLLHLPGWVTAMPSQSSPPPTAGIRSGHVGAQLDRRRRGGLVERPLHIEAHGRAGGNSGERHHHRLDAQIRPLTVVGNRRRGIHGASSLYATRTDADVARRHAVVTSTPSKPVEPTPGSVTRTSAASDEELVTSTTAATNDPRRWSRRHLRRRGSCRCSRGTGPRRDGHGGERRLAALRRLTRHHRFACVRCLGRLR